jgi:hypothetical protein
MSLAKKVFNFVTTPSEQISPSPRTNHHTRNQGESEKQRANFFHP